MKTLQTFVENSLIALLAAAATFMLFLFIYSPLGMLQASFGVLGSEEAPLSAPIQSDEYIHAYALTTIEDDGIEHQPDCICCC